MAKQAQAWGGAGVSGGRGQGEGGGVSRINKDALCKGSDTKS